MTSTTVITSSAHRGQPADEAHARQQRGEDRQVDGHREVFEDQDRQDHRRFPVAEPAQVAEHLGDDARGGDVGDAGHRQRSDRAPAQHERHDRSGSGVEHDVDQPGHPGAAQSGDQFARGVLQPQ
jgi:hypothetical protein